ncbi:hypothetical protein OUZ56_000230 [Daphnia magna]|uniref:Uncharacterized protein n=1 Tax=Daphnia magna TaxID=35525 RepID=A0ABQ9ZZQ8_9CRUS|nr:hypothetical protein OUZ56_000230 [Daphnia magna]
MQILSFATVAYLCQKSSQDDKPGTWLLAHYLLGTLRLSSGKDELTIRLVVLFSVSIGMADFQKEHSNNN